MHSDIRASKVRITRGACLLWCLAGWSGGGSAQQAPGYTLAQIEGNVGNKLNLPPGDFRGYLSLRDTEARESRAKLLSRFGKKELTLMEAGVTLYYLGLSYSTAPGKAAAPSLQYVQESANVYMDPFALLKTARYYLFGAKHDGVQLLDKDLDKGFEYFNTTWEVGAVLQKNGHADIWDMIVSNSLGIGDDFYGFSVNDQYPVQAKLAEMKPRLLVLRKNFAQQYRLTPLPDTDLTYEKHY